MRKFALVLLGLPALSLSAPIVIDDFTPRDLSQNRRIGGVVNYGEHTFVDSFAAPVLGGERDVELRVLESLPTYGVSVLAEFGESDGQPTFNLGFEGISTGGPLQGLATLQWDGPGDEAGNTGLDHVLNDVGAGVPLFSSDVEGFRVFYRSPIIPQYDPSVRVTMTLRSQGSILEALSQTIVIDDGNHALTFDFDTDAILAADSVSLSVYGNANHSRKIWLGLQRVETLVPEPSSLAALGLGLVAILRLRAKKVSP